MIGPSFKAIRRARFAILHALGEPSVDSYGPLARAVADAVADAADELYLFHPEVLAGLHAVLEELGFSFERTSYLMKVEIRDVRPAPFPEGYATEAVSPGDDTSLARFVTVRNRNFKEVLGSRDARVEDFRDIMESPENIPGGLIIVCAPDGTDCGTLLLERDEEEDSGFIGTVSIDTAHRRRGIARALIGKAMIMSKELGFRQTYLSVNATNAKALQLYQREGFKIMKAMSCMTIKVSL